MSPQGNGRSHAATEIVSLREGDRSLRCTIEYAFDIDGERYALLLPVDTPVDIFAWYGDEEEEEAAIVEGEQIDSIFEIAKAVLAEQDLTLHHSALTLTVAGDLPEIEDDEWTEIESDDGEVESLQLLANFYDEEQEYSVYAPLDPFFVFARLDDDNTPHLLPPEEFERLEPKLPPLDRIIEEKLFEESE